MQAFVIALVTALTSVTTAYLSGRSQNDKPYAEILAYVGEHSPAGPPGTSRAAGASPEAERFFRGRSAVDGSRDDGSEARTDNTSRSGANETLVIPTDTLVGFSAGLSGDRDGHLGALRLIWTLEGSPDQQSGIADCPRSNNARGGGVGSTRQNELDVDASALDHVFRYCELTFRRPGRYLLYLDVIDTDRCWKLIPRHWWIASDECVSSSTAVLALSVHRWIPPRLRIAPHGKAFSDNEPIQIDARLSRTFEARAPASWLWTIDGVPHSDGDVLDFKLSDVLSRGSAIDHVEVGLSAWDRFGNVATLPQPIVLTRIGTGDGRGISDDNRWAFDPLLTESTEANEASSVPTPSEVTRPPPPSVDDDVDGLCRGEIDEVVLSEPRTLDLGTTTCTLPRRVLTSGHALRIRATVIDSSRGVEIASTIASVTPPPFPPAASGRDGAPGIGPGASGGPGGDGVDGSSSATRDRTRPSPIVLEAERFAGILRVDNSGTRGREGQPGGRGGRGGDGAQGAPSRSGFLDCTAGPGRGGDGGAGGSGGSGGSGSNGTDGGAVAIRYGQIAPGGAIGITSVGGESGSGGHGGAGGLGGNGGAEGPLTSRCGSAGRAGRPGRDGVEGTWGANGRSGGRGLITVTDPSGTATTIDSGTFTIRQ